MGSSRSEEDLSASFVSGDKQQRLEFDHELAGYVRGHCERWDITAVLEPLQLLGAKTGQVQVHLHRSPPGSLAVTIQFELQPVACSRRAGWRASSAAGTAERVPAP